jgi:hypothetical protein
MAKRSLQSCKRIGLPQPSVTLAEVIFRPGEAAAVLLPTYDFASANRLFGHNLLTTPAASKNQETPFGAYLSLTSYILHHASLSDRASLYGLISLCTLRVLSEDGTLCKYVCGPDSATNVRLCRQRSPFLPSTPDPRPLAFQILDITIDTLTHNLRRRLDVNLYIATLRVMHRILLYQAQNHIRQPLAYHWPLLWQSLITTLRFLQQYSNDLTTQPSITTLASTLLNILALAITSGQAFLPSPTPHDDLFYKLVEASSVLTAFQRSYDLSPETSAIGVVISTAAHFHRTIEAEKERGRLGRHYSTAQISKVIREGYESLEVPSGAGSGEAPMWERWEAWREGDERSLLKRVGRAAVEDARRLIRSP